LYIAIFQRMPTPHEIELGVQYVKSNPGSGRADPTSTIAADKPPPGSRAARQAAMQAANAKKAQGRYSTQVGGNYDNHAPIDAWTMFAHALFQTNEAMFYD
jgi:hypothetical protein